MDTIVETQSGKLRGRIEGPAAVFKGVPYAAPPFGPNRMQPPRRREPWSGVRDALNFGPKSPQVEYPPGIREALAEVVGTGEDCLTLNIWAPVERGGKRPVMVWIPGGMFEFHATGGSAYYDGGRFARDGVVCVTIGHRVGAEGFLYLADGLANLGLLDQIAALEWVRDNIAAFGGDPSNVTVFGESAGAMSVAILMAMPKAKGLFRRAIVESGNTPMVSSAATAERIGRRLAEAMGVEPTRAAIAACSPEQVLQAQTTLRDELQAGPDPAFWGEVAVSYLPWAPTVDGDTLPTAPIDAIRAGAAADIDLIVGSNLDETRMFFVSDGSIDRVTDEALTAIATAYGLSAEGLDAYRRANPGASAGDLFSAVQTDWLWRIPAVNMADAQARHGRGGVFMYEFAWRTPQAGGRLGAAHGLEMPFVFDTLGLGTEPLLGPNPPQALADAMHGAWVTFAKTGSPGWPAYDPERRATKRFDVTPAVVDNPLGDVMDRWSTPPAELPRLRSRA